MKQNFFTIFFILLITQTTTISTADRLVATAPSESVVKIAELTRTHRDLVNKYRDLVDQYNDLHQRFTATTAELKTLQETAAAKQNSLNAYISQQASEQRYQELLADVSRLNAQDKEKERAKATINRANNYRNLFAAVAAITTGYSLCQRFEIFKKQ